jgi:hypothetical protein
MPRVLAIGKPANHQHNPFYQQMITQAKHFSPLHHQHHPFNQETMKQILLFSKITHDYFNHQNNLLRRQFIKRIR